MSSFNGFPKDTLKFLSALAKNNNREWFAENKQRYEESVLLPALSLIECLRKPLEKVAPMLTVEPKKSGGSLMRIYKDTRFSNDKTPYKTNIGIQFRHAAGKDVHAPGVYLHISPDECFFGGGMWRPDSTALQAIRAAIERDPQSWNKAIKNKRFRETYELYDDRLKTAPRGVDRNHPLIDDLRLKSFLGMCPLSKAQIESPQLLGDIPLMVKAAAPLMDFLCQAVEQPY